MEHVPQVGGGSQGVVARLDHLLEAGLGARPVLVEDLGLAEESEAVAGRDLPGARLVGLALAGFQVGQGHLVLSDHPVHEDLMVAVRRTGVTGEHVLHKRRSAPVAGQGEVRPGADDAGFGHASFLDVRVAEFAFLSVEIVQDQVALVNQRIQILVDHADVRDGAVVRIAELIHILGTGA